MRDADLVKSMRALVERGLLQLETHVARPVSPARSGLVFFDQVPESTLAARQRDIEQGGGAAEWYLVTSRPRGLEWKEKALARYGLWVVEVDEVDAVRAELTRLAEGQ